MIKIMELHLRKFKQINNHKIHPGSHKKRESGIISAMKTLGKVKILGDSFSLLQFIIALSLILNTEDTTLQNY